MKRAILLITLFLMSFTSLSFSKEAIDSHQIDSIVGKARETFDFPGLAIGIIVDRELVFTKGYGYRDVEEKLPVTDETVFMIGSATKSFTTFALAKLVEEGKVRWNDKVISILPDFRLKDPYATQEMTIRDLVTHTSGLPRHDFLWFFSNDSSDELYQKLQYLEPISSFREGFSYQNLMYMVAGKVIKKAAGQAWDSYVQEKILSPLGMESTSFSIEDLRSSHEFALPYIQDEDTFQRIPYHDLEHIGPAVTINSNVVDLAAWAKMLMNYGEFDEKQLLAAPHVKHLMSPQVVASVTVQGFPDSNEEFLENYGLGWMIQSFHGHYLVSHEGAIDGFSSNVALLPLDKIGIVVLTNRLGPNETRFISKAILASLIDQDPEQWLPEKVDVVPVNQEDFPTKKGTSPSHALEHLHYDMFQGEIKTSFAPLKVSLSFETDWYGNVKQLVRMIQFEGLEVPYVKVAQSHLHDPENLKIYTGI